MQGIATILFEEMSTSPKQRPAHVHISYALTLSIKPTSWETIPEKPFRAPTAHTIVCIQTLIHFDIPELRRNISIYLELETLLVCLFCWLVYRSRFWNCPHRAGFREILKTLKALMKALLRFVLFRSYLTKSLKIPEVIWREKLMADWSRTATQYCEKDESSLFKKNHPQLSLHALPYNTKMSVSVGCNAVEIRSGNISK
jgi:hypothetical protein